MFTSPKLLSRDEFEKNHQQTERYHLTRDDFGDIRRSLRWVASGLRYATGVRNGVTVFLNGSTVVPFSGHIFVSLPLWTQRLVSVFAT
jgi:hypothetical protein